MPTFQSVLEFNNNIGCIETLINQEQITGYEEFNNNIGCIETRPVPVVSKKITVFNNNIGCIETDFNNILNKYMARLITT